MNILNPRVGSSLILALSLIGAAGCEKTAFEKEHDRATARNPNWLLIQLDTSDERRRYRENETITLVSRYSSTVPCQFKIQTSNDNDAMFADLLHISTGETRMLGGMFGIVCCFSDV